MADTEHFTPHVCLRCQSINAAIPTEAQLRIMATEDYDPKIIAFLPRAMTQEQAVASEMLIAAIGGFTRAYGPEIAGARLSAVLDSLRVQIIRHRITLRILKAREPINARARIQYARCDYAAAHAIEAEPTPDYPGKARDDAWLNQGQPEAIKTREAVG
jgi:hypothetical protein